MKAGTFVSTASAAVLCAIVGSASADVIYVDPDAIGLPTGTNWFNAYRMVGTALAAASDGDEIWIASGRYEPPMSGWTLNVGASVRRISTIATRSARRRCSMRTSVRTTRPVF